MTSSETIVNQLKKRPMSSKELATFLVQGGHSKNESSARKMIERAEGRGDIESTKPIRFDKAFLYYLKNQKPGQKYARQIGKLLKDKPSYLRVLKTLYANRGLITQGQVAKASGCLPDTFQTGGAKENPGGRPRLERVLRELDELGILTPVANPGLFSIGKGFGSHTIKKGAFLRKLSIEQKLLFEIKDWVRTCYLVAYNSNSFRENEFSAVEFNQSFFDFHGPAYFGPFTKTAFRRSGASEDFLFGDLVGYRTFSEVDAESFIERYKSIATRWGKINLLPVVVAPSFSTKAYAMLRKDGVAAVPYSNILGKSIDRLLRIFWDEEDRLTVDDETSAESIESALKLVESTDDDGLDGLVGNLKGVLFELIVGLAWQQIGFDVSLQKTATDMSTFEECEFDVVVRRNESKCKLIECKGRAPSTLESKDEVERHFDYRCKIANDPYGWKVTESYKNVEAIFITSGSFSVEALEYAKSKRKSHGIQCTLWNRQQFLAWLRENDLIELSKLVEKYFA